jgi:predicted nucleic acid-binding protein
VHRPELTRKFRRVEGLDLRRVLQILETAEVVEPTSVPAVSPDPKDDMFLAAAHAGAADYLVSEDHHLLGLTQYQTVKIVDAHTFVQVLAQESAGQSQ